MRIPCFFKSGPLEAAYVNAIFQSEALRTYVTVEFLVDTGATKTTICDKDAIRFGIDYNALQKLDKSMLGIGGPVDTYVLKEAELAFHEKSRKTHVERLENLCFLRHSELTERILRIPSILGRDVLNKYALFYDRRQDNVYITDEPITH